MTIIFFDIPSKHSNNGWSPHTLKARIALNYKGISYKTQWVEYPDIEETLRKAGGTPTSKTADGRDLYTLPAIYDPATGKTITNSLDIVHYLEETYPDTPSLFPKGALAAIALLEHHYMSTVALDLRPVLLPPTCFSLNPKSAEYFRRTREAATGKPLEEFAPPGPVRDAAWAKVKEDLRFFAAIYAKNGEESPYFFGETFSYADVIVAGFLVWVRTILKPESEEWRTLASWDDNRWAKLLELMGEYL